MKYLRRSRSRLSQVGIEGTLLVLSPLPFLSLTWYPADQKLTPLIVSSVLCVCLGVTSLTLYRWPTIGKLSSLVGLGFAVILTWPLMVQSPFVALFLAAIYIFIFINLLDFQINFTSDNRNQHLDRCKQRLVGAAPALALFVLLALSFRIQDFNSGRFVLAVAWSITCGLALVWVWERKEKVFYWVVFILVSLGLGLGAAWHSGSSMLFLMVVGSCGVWLLRSNSKTPPICKHFFWHDYFGSPAKILPISFFGLCFLGAIFLSLPNSTNQEISILDAAFTAVSAVCVTGLIVLDTPKDFTLFGQVWILVLIQLGGLGIMSITTLALHALGRRLTIRQERLMTLITETSRKELLQTLAVILKFTFATEFVGFIALTSILRFEGLTWTDAVWKGLFTAISAFCNAGFALWSDSLVGFQTNGMFLHVVALLIILGGLAPATCLVVPRWIRGEKIILTMYIPLITSLVLLLIGTLSIMFFEWNGILSGLDFWGKLNNAWFQSVTLRTAGFNSVDLTPTKDPTFLVMIVLMIVGGSPGGTAGGAKTSTIGLLAVVFWATITGKDKVVVQNKLIRSDLVYKASAILTGFLITWLTSLLMLQITQVHVPSNELLFEAASAIGTVGLSLGATVKLDEIGKIVLMITMFAGRVGPMTLFMMLNPTTESSALQYTEAKITLT